MEDGWMRAWWWKKALGFLPRLLFSDTVDSLLGGGCIVNYLRIEIDLPDCEPQAERWTFRCWGVASVPRCHLKHRGLFICSLLACCWKAPRFCVTVKDSSSWFGQVVQCNKMHILLLHFTYNVLLNLLASPEHPATILTLVVVTSSKPWVQSMNGMFALFGLWDLSSGSCVQSKAFFGKIKIAVMSFAFLLPVINLTNKNPALK